MQRVKGGPGLCRAWVNCRVKSGFCPLKSDGMMVRGQTAQPKMICKVAGLILHINRMGAAAQEPQIWLPEGLYINLLRGTKLFFNALK